MIVMIGFFVFIYYKRKQRRHAHSRLRDSGARSRQVGVSLCSAYLFVKLGYLLLQARRESTYMSAKQMRRDTSVDTSRGDFSDAEVLR
jgi:uncharacterized membrane protein